MPDLKSLFRREYSFISIGIVGLFLAVVCGLLFPISEEVNMEDSDGGPDGIAEYFSAIRGLDAGYSHYPQGHKFREFQRAAQSSAKRGSGVALPWVERGPGNVGGRTRAVVLDPTDPDYNTWYVASVGGGVWRGRRVETGGRERVEWTPLTDHLPTLGASALEISRSNPDILYLGTGEGVLNDGAVAGVGMFKTTDRGETWTHLSSTTARTYDDDWRYVNRLAVHPENPDIVVVATNRGIFRTEDGGVTFQNVYRHAQRWRRVQDLRANPDNFDIQFATVWGYGILRSMDGGRTWEESLVSFAYRKRRIEIAISQSDPNVIWAVAEGTSDRTAPVGGEDQPVANLYRSLDNGESWRFVDKRVDSRSAFLEDQGWYDMAILVDPYDPNKIYVGGIDIWTANIRTSRTSELVYGVVDSVRSKLGWDETFLSFTRFGGSSQNGSIDLGYLEDDPGNFLEDTFFEDVTSVEIRWGGEHSQKAHRFTVPPTGGTTRDGQAGVKYPDYLYQDYVDVPFEVWDTDNNRQLMVSFRDQRRDGEYTLIPCRLDEENRCTDAREYIFISKYDYDASAPLPDLARKGGLQKGMIYFLWPVLGEDSPRWDGHVEETISIYFSGAEFETEQYAIRPKWDGRDMHVDHHALHAVPVDESRKEFFLFNGNDGGIAYSYDSGNNWGEGDTYGGFNTSQFWDATKEPGASRYIGGMQDNGSRFTDLNPDSQRPWRLVTTLIDDGYDVIWKSKDSVIAAAQYNRLWRRANTPQFVEVNRRDRENAQWITTLAWTPESGDAVYSLYPLWGPVRSLEFAERNSWELIHRSWRGDKGLRGGKVRLSLADPNVLWAGYIFYPDQLDYGALHVSTNARDPAPREGVRNPLIMRQVRPPDTAPKDVTISGLATHPFSRATAYVMLSVACQPKLFRTEDMGRTWEDLSGFEHNSGEKGKCDPSTNGFPDADVYDIEVMPEAPRIIWAGTDLGLFESKDHGKTWAYADNGLPAVSIIRIRIVDDEIILATHGRGVWTVDLNRVQTSSSPSVAGVPDAFELNGNYPNPFNPTTNITFRVANSSHIRVTVFDVLGRKVATLTDQAYEGGTHEIRWDASQVSSGQYIYRMEADGKVIGAKSMLLVK